MLVAICELGAYTGTARGRLMRALKRTAAYLPTFLASFSQVSAASCQCGGTQPCLVAPQRSPPPPRPQPHRAAPGTWARC